MILLIILLAIPLIEIAVMIKVGQWIGFWPALGLVIATGLGGAFILGRSGLASALKVQEAMLRGEPPVAAMLDGALIVMSGVLLLTPGFVADVLGLLLLVPFVRHRVTGWALSHMVIAGGVAAETSGFEERDGFRGRPEQGNGRTDPGAGPIIEGEFERLDERPIGGARRRPGEPPPHA